MKTLMPINTDIMMLILFVVAIDPSILQPSTYDRGRTINTTRYVNDNDDIHTCTFFFFLFILSFVHRHFAVVVPP